MNIHVVLVRTESAGNIGSAARAVANMGGDRLILINPKCRIGVRAREMAAGAQEALKRRTVYKTWEDFYAAEGEGLRLALTRRGGRKRKIFPLDEKLKEIRKESKKRLPKDLYLIFGPEKDGLDHDDLAFANFAVHLPVYGAFGSLNLAQAVLLGLFVTRQVFNPETMPEQVKGHVPEVAQPLYFPDKLIREWLTAMGFNIDARKQSAYLTLKRLFLQNRPTHTEISVLEAILQQNVRKLKSLCLATEDVADDLGDVTGKDI